MAVSRLALRLARIRESRMQGKEEDAEIAGAAVDAPAPAGSRVTAVLHAAADFTGATAVPLPGWTLTTPYVFERETLVPGIVGRERFSSFLPLLFPRERSALSAFVREDGCDLPAGSLVFFDLETTGLSHGAGTVAFMAGIARLTGDGLLIRQILLADYPGEADFLARFAELAGDDPVLVSFNGKCFDSQILFTRYMMNGLKPAFMLRPVLHLDLLFPSRRLWKAEFGSCRLSVLEERILGVERIGDLPGSEAPDAWFDYVRSGIAGRLLAIGDHNREDCASLARLLFALDDAIASGTGRAALIRAFDLRASGDHAGAAILLAPLAASGDTLALRLLAIDAEHRIRDLEAALAYASVLGDVKRSTRIQAKLDKKNR